VTKTNLTLDIGSSAVRLRAILCFSTHNEEQYIGVLVGLCRNQGHLLPLHIGGTHITAEAGAVGGAPGGLGRVHTSSGHISSSLVGEFQSGKHKMLKVQDFVGDKITITVDWVIERKDTAFATA
jgi:hypothetical protein